MNALDREKIDFKPKLINQGRGLMMAMVVQLQASHWF